MRRIEGTVQETGLGVLGRDLQAGGVHPKTRFLNCSLNAPHPLVRTYYPRTYEVTYLLGMLAGIVSHSDKVGYVAANPVYGVPAAINAFAQAQRSTTRLSGRTARTP